jgi:phytoene dehydrogenase-like protein
VSHSWDYIVVGAGHNGLSAACTLAMAGKSVLVVEQRDIAGGLSVSHPFVEKAPQHLLSIGAMDDALMAHSPLVDLYGLKSRGYDAIPLNAPYGWMSEEGDTLVLQRDFDKTVEEIRYFSSNDAKTYQEVRVAIDFVMGALEHFMPQNPDDLSKIDIGKMLLKTAGSRSLRKTLGKMLSVSAFEMISDTFESEAMRGLWAYWCSMFAPATEQASGLYLASFGSVHRAGIFRPKGGMTGLIGAMAKTLTDHGGEIRLNARVEKCLVSDNQVLGVRLTNGEDLHAVRGVLANCAPQVTLGQLVEDSELARELKAKANYIPANSVGVAPFKIDMAVAGKLTYEKAQQKRARRDGLDVRKTTFMTGTLDQHLAEHRAFIRGESVEFPLPLYFAIMSANDETIAPEGQDVLYLYANVPVSPVGGWDECKSGYSDRIMANAKNYISGLDAEIGRVETTPKDFETGFGAPNGAYFHVDMIATRLGANRPAPGLGGYKTPIQGLYLASAGCHPSGGVCGWPGRNAALCALSSET